MLRLINIVQDLKKTNQAIGKSRAGLTTKIHAITDGKGHAINFAITGGNTHDVTQAKELMSSAIHKVVSILADRAYDSNRIVEYIESESAKAVIPSRKNRKTERDYDKEVYKNRNQIERFFNKIKQCRRVATRYDKLITSFLSVIQLAATLIVLPKFSLNV